jgi:hypothetical protein
MQHRRVGAVGLTEAAEAVSEAPRDRRLDQDVRAAPAADRGDTRQVDIAREIGVSRQAVQKMLTL